MTIFDKNCLLSYLAQILRIKSGIGVVAIYGLILVKKLSQSTNAQASDTGGQTMYLQPGINVKVVKDSLIIVAS